MKAASWKVAATAAVLAVVFVPTASAKSGARVKLSVLPLPASAIGPVAKSLPLQQDSGGLANGGLDVGAGVPVSPNRSLLSGPALAALAKVGRIGGYALDYGQGASGGAGVTEIRTGVDQYKTSADAKKGLAFWKLDDRGIAECGGGGLSIGLRQQTVAAAGDRRFAFLVSYRDANITPLFGVDEQFTEGRYEADVSVWASTAAAARQLAPRLAAKLDKRITRALAGRLHANPVTLPVRQQAGPAPGGPDLASLALKATDLTGPTTVGRQFYTLESFFLPAPVLSDYQVDMFPAGQFSQLDQEIGWYQTANQANFVTDFRVAHVGKYSLDLSSLGDGARGALANFSTNGEGLIVFSSGRLAEYIELLSSSAMQPAQVVSIAHTAASYIDAAGLGTPPA